MRRYLVSVPLALAAVAHLYAVRWYADEAVWRRDRVLSAHAQQSWQDVSEYSESLDVAGALGLVSLLLAVALTVLAAGAWRGRIAAVRPIAWGLLPIQVFLVGVGRYRAEQYRSGYEEAWFIPQPQTVDQHRGVAAGVLALGVALVVLAFWRVPAADGVRPRRLRGVAVGVTVAMASLVVLVVAALAAARYVNGLPDSFAAPRAVAEAPVWAG
ncbi:hypothetical protein [Cryptosporangium minutisporangium]|uniref:Uncharacterized protein n=1 Tax=Cryptosporangium minutisporangium TaxID=113569 RepID=A0ABP6TD21_9ACTN